MTAQLETYGATIAPEGVSGDLYTEMRRVLDAEPTPGTLWERVEESGANLVTICGWLYSFADGCTCGMGGAPYGHEPGCGLEPLYHFDKEGNR